MSWEVEYLPEAHQDLKDLDGSQKNLVLKAIKKLSKIHSQFTKAAMGNHLETKMVQTFPDFSK